MLLSGEFILPPLSALELCFLKIKVVFIALQITAKVMVSRLQENVKHMSSRHLCKLKPCNIVLCVATDPILSLIFSFCKFENSVRVCTSTT